MTEQELFAAYRTPAGYSAQCACGTWIDAPDSGEEGVAEAIAVHNATEDHWEWRREQMAVDAVRRKTRHRCPCCDGRVA